MISKLILSRCIKNWPVSRNESIFAGDPVISSVAVCAGSGGSVLRDVQTGLYVTGEMSHHEVLHAVYNGTAVILCEHSNTERGYLTVLRERLKHCMQSEAVEVLVSESDCDPLTIV